MGSVRNQTQEYVALSLALLTALTCPIVTPLYALHGTQEMGLKECQLEGNWPLLPIIENGGHEE